MKISRKLRKVALLALAAASAWRYVGRRKRRSSDSGPGATRRPAGVPWPEQVQNFVGLLSKRGATVRDVRLEQSGGKRAWVVEWNNGRTLSFPEPRS